MPSDRQFADACIVTACIFAACGLLLLAIYNGGL